MENTSFFFEKILDSISESIVVINKKGEIVFVNKNWLNFADENNSNIKDKWQNVNYIDVCKTSVKIGDVIAQKALFGILSVLEKKEESFNFEYPCHSKNEQRWFLMSVNYFNLGKKEYLVISHKNITKRVINEERMKKLCMLDPLTSLANRRTFKIFFDREWNRNKRDQTPITLAMVDIDDFKILNDTFGHQVGDLVLMKIANIFNNLIKRASDLSARYGGEEFVIIFSNSSFNDIKNILNQILKEVSEIIIEGELPKDYKITATIGVCSTIPNNKSTKENLLKIADKALYKGKEEGKNRIILNTYF